MHEPPAALGPYRILDTLGIGGMGVVYEGVHETTGARVAIKTVKVANQRLLSSFRREVRALGRVRHPNVVRILDEGVHEGLPWYAMELLDGVPLHRYAETAPPRASSAATRERPDAATDVYDDTATGDQAPAETAAAGVVAGLAATLRLVRRLCDALAYVHGEGIVHRDLKPSNVVVRADGTPVLVDFGIVAQFAGASGREVLDLAGDAVGTVSYMAPEQLLGELVDARADLYSLGCILYELVTGRVPFPGKDWNAVALAKLRRDPATPSHLVEGVPPELDALILKLLAREPRDRIGYADTVAAAIARLSGVAERATDLPKPQAYLYRPGLAGRRDELAALERHAARLAAGTGGLVLVGGESGAGKTRLLTELTRTAYASRTAVLLGECAPAAPASAEGERGGGAPLEGLLGPLRAVADRCRERGPAETARVVGDRAAVLARYEPSIADLPGARRGAEPADLPPEAARLRLFTYLAETLGALTSDAPVLLLLDDLQWADDLTLGFLELLVQGDFFERRRMLVVAAYRVEEATERLERLAASPRVERVELDRLGRDEVASMVSDMLAITPAPALLAKYLARYSAGNPFFVAEYVRAAVDGGLVVRDDAGEWHAVEGDADATSLERYEMLGLPRSLEQIVARRLASLPADARRVASAAAVLGREVREDLLAAVSGVAGGRLVDAVGELVRRDVLVDDAGRLRFVHDALREGAYAALDGGDRAALHRRAAVAVEALAPGDAGRSLATLAHHWERAGETELARDRYLAAAREAKSRFALRESQRLYHGYLRLTAEPTAESVRARNELAREVLRLRGRIAETVAEQERALEEARRLGDTAAEAGGLVGLGTVHRETGRFEEASELFERALDLARAVGDRRRESETLGALANTRMKQGALDEAQTIYEASLEIARAEGDRSLEAFALGDLAVVLDTKGEAAEARRLYEQALEIARAVGNRRSVGIMLGNLALLTAGQGRPAEARPLYQESIAIHRQTGDVQSEGTVLGNLAFLCEELGEVADARQLYEEALAIHRRIGNRMYEGIVLEDWATLERRSGRFARAEELIGEAERVLREARSPFYLAVCLCETGHVRLANGEAADACLDEAREIAATLPAGGESHLGRVIARLERAVAAAEAGEPLFRGERPADLPDGLRQWLVRTGQL